MTPNRLKAYLYLLVASLIWALAGPVIKFTLGTIPPLLFLTYRFFISGLIGIIILVFTRAKIPKDIRTLGTLLVYALLTSSITLGLLFFGLDKTTVVESSAISLLGPLFVTIAGVRFLKEHVTSKEKVGLLIAIVGMLLTIIEPLLTNGQSFGKISGNILILGYLLTNAISAVLCKKLLRVGIKDSDLTNITFMVGFLSLLPFLFFQLGWRETIGSITTLPATSHFGVFFMAVFSGTIAYWLYNRAQKTIEVSEAALFAYLYPLLSIPIAMLWLKEKITTTFILGAVIILIGVVIAESKRARKTV